MPLRCLDRDGSSVHAFALGTAAWDELAADNRRSRSLKMPCCAARVSLKRSRLGMQFFAHVGRGGCMTGDESPEHLALKQLAVDAARNCGWHAETEVAAADGSWRADVLATRGRHRVAVEIQWSSQTDDETLRRTAQYAAAGVRPLWLFRQRSYPANADVPALRVEGSLAKGFTISSASVTSVLEGVFDRRLGFGFAAGPTATRVIGGIVHCWGRDCGSLTRVVTAIELGQASSRCTLGVEDLPPGAPATAALIAALPRGDAAARIRPRRKSADAPTLTTNGCFSCDRILASSRAAAATRTVLASIELRIDSDFAALVSAHPSAQLAWGVRVAPAEPTR